VTEPLSAFLGSVFGRSGLVLHGETEVRKRKELERRFQEDETISFFVLSLKAGGSGLNPMFLQVVPQDGGIETRALHH